MAQDINEILNSINQYAGYGSYGEGQISAAYNAFKQLQDQFQAGQLSSDEFTKIGDAILPQLKNKINSLAGGGSASANAAWNAGGQELLKIIKDYDIIKSSKNILGRDITANDLVSFRPYFEGGNDIGQAYLAQVKDYESKSPEALKNKSGQYSGDVNSAFQELFGRNATPEEIQHYGAGLASGGLDTYQLKDYIKQTDEYRTAQDKQFREGLNTELGSYDQEAFNKGKEDILSRYTKAGIQHSPALDLALTNLMGDIAKERGRYLAGLSAQQYGGNKELARSDYEATLNKYMSDRNYERDLRQNQMNDYLNRGREVGDYYRQRDDYMSMLDRIPRNSKSNKWSQIGGLAGAAAGSYWGPQGASAGYQIGQGAGGFFD